MGTGRNIALSIVTLATAAACAVLNPLYRPATAPEVSGLVIVRGEMITPLERWGKVLAGGAKEDVRAMDYGRIVSEGDVSTQGRAIGGVVIFEPATPGRYRIGTLGYVQRRSVGPYPVDFEPPAEVRSRYTGLAFEVRPGEVTVLSKAVIRYRDATMTKDFELASWDLVDDAEGAKDAIKSVLTALDPASPWHAVLERKLASP